MSNLYDSPAPEPLETEEGLNMDNAVALPAGITLQSGSFDGKRWFALLQGGQSIAVTYDELGGLISGLAGVWRENKPSPAPEQLQLFDPENPRRHRMNTEWTPPNDLNDARAHMRQLQAEIEEIDAQLRSTKKKKSMDHDAWLEWRERTIWAKVHRVQDLRQTKDYLYAIR